MTNANVYVQSVTQIAVTAVLPHPIQYIPDVRNPGLNISSSHGNRVAHQHTDHHQSDERNGRNRRVNVHRV